jgi:hypothetical protein
MAKKPLLKTRRAQHQRNTEIVQKYLQGVATGSPSPLEIEKEYGFSHSRLYQILAKYNVKPTYKQKWLDKD